jgi:hypothetical protein
MKIVFKKGDKVRVIPLKEMGEEGYHSHSSLAGRLCTVLDPENGDWIVTDIPYDDERRTPYPVYARTNYWKVLSHHLRHVDKQLFFQFPKGHA